MTLVLTCKDRTETIEFLAAFDEYCCIFDEICRVIMETFDLHDLSMNYHMKYYDPSYNIWINFNIHVTKRISEILRRSPKKILKIRIEQRRTNHNRSLIPEQIVDPMEIDSPVDDSK